MARTNFATNKELKATFNKEYHASDYVKGNDPRAIGLTVTGIICNKTRLGKAFTLACTDGVSNIGVNIPSWLGKKIITAVNESELDYVAFFDGMVIESVEPFTTDNGDSYNIIFDVAE